MLKKLSFFLLFVVSASQLFSEKIEPVKKIQSLSPDFSEFTIEPYLPSNFIFFQKEEDDDYICAPPGVYEEYLKGSKLVHPPFIRIMVRKYSKSDMNEIDKDKNIVDEYVSSLRSYFPEYFHSSTLNWGKYEVKAVKVHITFDEEYMAFIDLKGKEGGTFINFSLMYYKEIEYGNGNKPSKKDLEFWNNFLKKTKSS